MVKSDDEKIGRNDPCWCGSGRSTRSATAPSGRPRAHGARDVRGGLFTRGPGRGGTRRLGSADGDDLGAGLRLQPHGHLPGRGDDPRPRAARRRGGHRRERRLRARGPRPDDGDPVHRPATGLQRDRPADLPHPRPADPQRELPDPWRRRVQRARGAALGPVRPRRAAGAVRDRHHRLGAQRARGRLRDLPRAHPARGRRGDGERGAGAATGGLLQRERDPGPFADRDLRGRRDHLDRGSGRRLPGDRREPDDPLRELPRDLRAGTGGEREPALGRLRAQPR
ncbi:MAG: SEC-C metal-binding domain-containing protein [Solirubrobacterales bacterium]